jgi:hypothetical protein
MLGDLRTLVDAIRGPLAVRSSSLLEDALGRPFAGVYETKMTPNNQPDPSARFQRLTEAVKFVYASTFFGTARDYLRSTDCGIEDEKMAVIVQEVVGTAHGDRFYPTVSGVARSFNFYPVGDTRREDGVVHLALGLGKTIVEGGICYTYSPARPKAPPPFASPGDRMANSQKSFWAVNVGQPPPYDPIAETEYLVQADLAAADYDDTLRHIASTYVGASDRFSPGVGSDGPRVVDFAPLLVLEEYPVNRVVQSLLDLTNRAVGRDIEIEFAMTFPRERDAPPHVGFLQVRPMVVPEHVVALDDEELSAPDILVSSQQVMGNGVTDGVRDVVYLKPGTFATRHTRAIAAEVAQLNARLTSEQRPYLLIGFGRWGSIEPWLGVPVRWGQIAGAAAIVEVTRPDLWTDPSQGSHFFHNVSSFGVSYFFVPHESQPEIDWAWLDAQPAEAELEFVRLVRADEPFLVKVDGRSGRGAVWYPARDAGA